MNTWIAPNACPSVGKDFQPDVRLRAAVRSIYFGFIFSLGAEVGLAEVDYYGRLSAAVSSLRTDRCESGHELRAIS